MSFMANIVGQIVSYCYVTYIIYFYKVNFP